MQSPSTMQYTGAGRLAANPQRNGHQNHQHNNHQQYGSGGLEEFSRCFMRKLWWLEMVNFIEVLEDIGWFGFWDVSVLVTDNLERIWH